MDFVSFDDNTLARILLRCSDPSGLGSTCQRLHRLISNQAFERRWLLTWYPKLAVCRPMQYAALTWQRAKGWPIDRVAGWILDCLPENHAATEASSGDRWMHGVVAVIEYQPRPQVVRSAQLLLRKGSGLKALVKLCPEAGLLLLPYAVKAGNAELTTALAHDLNAETWFRDQAGVIHPLVRDRAYSVWRLAAITAMDTGRRDMLLLVFSMGGAYLRQSSSLLLSHAVTHSTSSCCQATFAFTGSCSLSPWLQHLVMASGRRDPLAGEVLALLLSCLPPKLLAPKTMAQVYTAAVKAGNPAVLQQLLTWVIHQHQEQQQQLRQQLTALLAAAAGAVNCLILRDLLACGVHHKQCSSSTKISSSSEGSSGGGGGGGNHSSSSSGISPNMSNSSSPTTTSSSSESSTRISPTTTTTTTTSTSSSSSSSSSSHYLPFLPWSILPAEAWADAILAALPKPVSLDDIIAREPQWVHTSNRHAVALQMHSADLLLFAAEQVGGVSSRQIQQVLHQYSQVKLNENQEGQNHYRNLWLWINLGVGEAPFAEGSPLNFEMRFSGYSVHQLRMLQLERAAGRIRRGQISSGATSLLNNDSQLQALWMDQLEQAFSRGDAAAVKWLAKLQQFQSVSFWWANCLTHSASDRTLAHPEFCSKALTSVPALARVSGVDERWLMSLDELAEQLQLPGELYRRLRDPVEQKYVGYLEGLLVELGSMLEQLEMWREWVEEVLQPGQWECPDLSKELLTELLRELREDVSSRSRGGSSVRGDHASGGSSGRGSSNSSSSSGDGSSVGGSSRGEGQAGLGGDDCLAVFRLRKWLVQLKLSHSGVGRCRLMISYMRDWLPKGGASLPSCQKHMGWQSYKKDGAFPCPKPIKQEGGPARRSSRGDAQGRSSRGKKGTAVFQHCAASSCGISTIVSSSSNSGRTSSDSSSSGGNSNTNSRSDSRSSVSNEQAAVEDAWKELVTERFTASQGRTWAMIWSMARQWLYNVEGLIELNGADCFPSASGSVTSSTISPGFVWDDWVGKCLVTDAAAAAGAAAGAAPGRPAAAAAAVNCIRQEVAPMVVAIVLELKDSEQWLKLHLRVPLLEALAELRVQVDALQCYVGSTYKRMQIKLEGEQQQGQFEEQQVEGVQTPGGSALPLLSSAAKEQQQQLEEQQQPLLMGFWEPKAVSQSALRQKQQQCQEDPNEQQRQVEAEREEKGEGSDTFQGQEVLQQRSQQQEVLTAVPLEEDMGQQQQQEVGQQQQQEVGQQQQQEVGQQQQQQQEQETEQQQQQQQQLGQRKQQGKELQREKEKPQQHETEQQQRQQQQVEVKGACMPRLGPPSLQQLLLVQRFYYIRAGCADVTDKELLGSALLHQQSAFAEAALKGSLACDPNWWVGTRGFRESPESVLKSAMYFADGRLMQLAMEVLRGLVGEERSPAGMVESFPQPPFMWLSRRQQREFEEQYCAEQDQMRQLELQLRYMPHLDQGVLQPRQIGGEQQEEVVWDAGAGGEAAVDWEVIKGMLEMLNVPGVDKSLLEGWIRIHLGPEAIAEDVAVLVQLVTAVGAARQLPCGAQMLSNKVGRKVLRSKGAVDVLGAMLGWSSRVVDLEEAPEEVDWE